MSVFEIIDNLDKLDYKFNKEKYTSYEYNDIDLVSYKYDEIVDQIFKKPSYEESHINNCYNYKLAFQEKNKEVLEYIIKKYNINKEFIDKFYNKFYEEAEKFDVNYDYIYLFIKHSFGDLLINKYTMARFTILVKIVEKILKANFKWYNDALSGSNDLNKVISFNTSKSENILTEIIDYIFTKHFNWNRIFRKYYVFKRIEDVTDYDFEDQTQYRDCFKEYDDNGYLTYTFPDYCSDNCLPWSRYIDYVGLNEEETKKAFIDYNYLKYYESVEDFFDEHIYYECNIIDINNYYVEED